VAATAATRLDQKWSEISSFTNFELDTTLSRFDVAIFKCPQACDDDRAKDFQSGFAHDPKIRSIAHSSHPPLLGETG